MTVHDMITGWLSRATTEELEAKFEELAPSQEFGHRDAENRAVIRQRVRKELDARNAVE